MLWQQNAKDCNNLVGIFVKNQSLKKINLSLILALSGGGAHATAADQELLDILLKNGAINKTQYNSMAGKEGMASSELLDVLAKNGTISKDQYDNLTKKHPAVAAKPAEPKLVEKAPEKDAAHVKLGENGLEVASDDGNFKMKVGGRMQLDSQVAFNGSNSGNLNPNHYDTQLATGAGFRRLRLYTEGTMYKDYNFRFEYDFVRGNGTTAAGITDAYTQWVHFKPFALTFGQQNEGKSLESVGSNNIMPFIERSLPNNAFIEFNNKYQVGLTAEDYGRIGETKESYGVGWNLRGGITTEGVGGGGNTSVNSQGNANRSQFSGDESYQLVGRGALMPYKDKEGNLAHLGAWGSWRDLNNNYNPNGSFRNGGWSFASQPDTPFDRTNWVNTGNLTTGANNVKGSKRADEISMFGLELAGALGPAWVSAEYMQTIVSGFGYDNDNLKGYYVQGGYFLTGETRPWDEKKAAWSRVKPKNNLDFNGGWGAVEALARFDLIDMNTRNVHGGSMDAGTLGLNWYWNPHVRLMTNFVHVFNVATITDANGKVVKCNSADLYKGVTAAGVQATSNAACFSGLSPNVWEMALRLDY